MRTLTTKTILAHIFVGTLLATPFGLTAQDQEKPPTQGSAAAKMAGMTDAKTFIKEAAQANSSEVALAEVAARKAQNAEVKAFAEQMRKDHTEANQKLQPIAQAHGIVIGESADAKEQKKISRMEKLTGEQFDKEYMKDMLKDHQQDISKFEKAAQQLQEADVKEYAQTTLPTLREHLQHAKAAAKAAGLDDATISSPSEPMGGSAEDSGSVSGSKKSSSDPKSTP